MRREKGTEFVVPFDRRFVRRLRSAALFGTILCALGTVSAASPSWERYVVVPLSVVGILSGLILLTGTAAWRKRPALAADEEGLTVGFLLGRRVRFAWTEVERISVDFGPPFAHELVVVIRLRDETSFDARVSLSARLNGRVARRFGHPLISIGTRAFALSWGEIAKSLGTFVPTEDPDSKLGRMTASVTKRIGDRLTLNGELKALEDYRRVFRTAPLGNWSDAKYCVSPADSHVGFRLDGTGWAGYGAAFMFGHVVEFDWRGGGEQAIEVRPREEDGVWTSLDYDFFEDEGQIVIGFSERIPDDDQEFDGWIEWTQAFSALMTFGGPCPTNQA